MGKNNLHKIKKSIIDTIQNSYYNINKNYKYFRKVSKNKEEILNAAQWLLDNFYMIERTYKEIKLCINKNFLEHIPYTIVDNKITVRILNISRNYINCGNKIELNELCSYINKIQKYNKDSEEYDINAAFTMSELNFFPLTLKISLITNLAAYTDELVSMQKEMISGRKAAEYFVDNLEDYHLNNSSDKKIKEVHDNNLFLRAFFNVLRNNSVEYTKELKYINEYLNFDIRTVENLENISVKEKIPAEKMKEYFLNIRKVEDIQWNLFFEKTSIVERILLKDPCEVYQSMDEDSKNYYRHKIEELSSAIDVNEINFTEDILKNALKSKIYKEDDFKTHVGYYIIDDGVKKVNGCYHNLNDVISPGIFVGIIALLTIIFVFLVLKAGMIMGAVFTINQLIISALVLLVPANECAVSLVNWIVSKTVAVRVVPKLDFSRGVPDNCKTIVVIPTITDNPKKIERLMKNMEVMSEGNKDKNIYFALLADLCDSDKEVEEYDKEIISCGLKCVNELNEKYCEDTYNPKFYFMARPRIYNEKQNVYMCHERKRGKLMEFMSLLRDKDKDYFNVISNDITPLKKAQYIITLDDDTYMPRETAHKLIGAMSHVLNIPHIKDSKVVRGYGIMQPKIGITLEAKYKTLFTTIFAGENIVDAYSTAYSDTYQDLFGEGSFTGKGIINIDEFLEMIDGNIKENRILSHDLLEGGLSRSALVSDVEFLDGYPSTYMASSERLHRWTRGDWQLFGWLFSKKISFLYKWKIIDNLKRTLIAPAMLISLILSLTYLKNNRIILLSLFVIVMPFIFRITDFVVTPKYRLSGTFKSFEQLFLIAAFIPFQCFFMIDAIFITIYRLCISRKHLLEWKSSDNLENLYKNSFKSYLKRMWISPVMGLLVLYLSFFTNPVIFIYNIVFAVLWICTPYIAYYISRDIPQKEEKLTQQEEIYLRNISRRIFAYYEDFIIEENNYLPPDNYQEYPYKGAAKRTSPTNIGMGLIAQAAAYDFGYITLFEFVDKVDIMLSNMKELEKVNGHYLNWYDTVDKKPLFPRYISTVDNGNLLANLWEIKQYLLDIKDKPVIRKIEVNAVEDIYRIIKEEKETVSFRFDESIGLNQYKSALEKIHHAGEVFIKNEKIHDEEIIYWTNKICNECNRKVHNYECIFDGLTDIKNIIPDFEAPNINEIIAEVEEKMKSSSGVCDNIYNEKLIYIKSYKSKIDNLIAEINKISIEMDFKFLYDKSKKLFYTGYNVEENSFGNTYYDLLASEARTASFVAIAKNDIPKEHWFKLNRSMTNAYNSHTLVSWSGTMFEYFMPSLLMKNYKHTLLNKTYKGVIHAQKAYAKQKKIPFGISESAFYEFDLSENYQYKAFGIPGLGLKRGLEDEIVVSPYSTLMILPFAKKAAIKNLKKLEKYGCKGRYGFIESLDFTKARKDKLIQKKEKVDEKNTQIKGRRNVQECEQNVDNIGITVDKSVNNVHKSVKNKYRILKKSHVYSVDIVDNLKNDLDNSHNISDSQSTNLSQKHVNIDRNVDKSVDKVYNNEHLKSDDIFNDKIKPYNIQTYMVHHLGMSIMALDNIINNKILIEKFHSIPQIKATELLLKENVPSFVTYEHAENYYLKKKYVDSAEIIPREYDRTDYIDDKVLLMSNGRYSSMITSRGNGYSKKDDIMLYRFKKDTTNNDSGMFFYIKNLNSNNYWSASYEPCKKEAEEYKVLLNLDKAVFERKDGNIKTKMESVISTEDNYEIRKITIDNLGDNAGSIEITSYSEVILTSFNADVVHPAFSNLFVQTEYVEDEQMLIASRRPRVKNAKIPYMFHKIVCNGDILTKITYETSRLNFIGRNRNLKNPKAMDNDKSLDNTTGTVLDPVMSLRVGIRVESKERREIYFVTGYSESQKEIYDTVRDKCAAEQLKNAFEDYSIYINTELHELNMRSSMANLYQDMAAKILLLSDERKDTEKYIEKISKHQKDLWAYGISGDLPIILAVIKAEKDIHVLSSVIRFHNYLALKNVKCDLVIYNEEAVSYDEPLQKNIYAEINMKNAGAMINVSGGIFIHNKSTMSEEIRDFIKGICRIYVECDKGSLINIFKGKSNIQVQDNNEIEAQKLNNKSHIETHNNNLKQEEVENYIKKQNDDLQKQKEVSDDNSSYSELYKELDFYNGYGGFDKKDNSYVIILKDNKNTPAPWINVISNKNFGFHVSESGSAYTWCGNSRENKLTPWSNDFVKDPCTEALYIRDNESGKYFSICPKPVRDKGEYIIRHKFGSSEFEHTAHNIKSSVKMFVPVDKNIKVQIVTLENLDNRDRKISLFYYAKLVLGVYNGENSQYISTYINDKCIKGRNPYSEYFGSMYAYLTIGGGESLSFSGNNKEFIGLKGDIEAPKALKKNKLSNECGSIYEPCLSCETSYTLKAFETKKFIILLGQDEEEKLEEYVDYYDVEKAENELRKVYEYWNDILGNIQVSTCDSSFDYMINGWLLYETISCRYFSRSAFYQSGGAYGFRDQLQDSMAAGFIKPEIMKNQIIISASRQYKEGDVQHWWHPVINSGIRTRFSDDLLWLPYVVAYYISTTGDYGILDEKAPYLNDEPLKDGEDERYTIVNSYAEEASIYEHCLKAIEKSLKFGVHNIPLMGSGDWNDGMSTVGNKGRGESVWLGYFIYSILNDFIKISEYKKDYNTAEYYKEKKEFIKENIEKNAWDGGWYRRAFFDDGTPLGSKDNPECQIDSLAQSWSVISDMEKEDEKYSKRAEEAMKAVDKNLVKKDKGMILLLAPPFDNSNLEPGYIKGYVPGVRENGGQYTHAAVWVIIALTKMKDKDKAYEYYKMINPINHTGSQPECRTYKLEPYVMAADVYIKEPHAGRGGWSWYTGAAGWMYRAGIESILGLHKVEDKGYKLVPCVPSSWNEYEIKINNKTEAYVIKAVRSDKNYVKINGEVIEGDIIPRNMGKLNIEVHFN